MFVALPLYDDAPHTGSELGTYGLITACGAVFLWQLGQPDGGDEAALSFGMIPAVLFHHATLPAQLQHVAPWMTIFTSMFLHGGWAHILGNMLYLWLFGRGVEAPLGLVRFLALYFISGVAAAMTQAAIDPHSTVPMIGASGAIAGVLGAYLILHPRGNVVTLLWVIIFVRLVSVPAVILLGLWFLLQVLGALGSEGEPGVAVWAHVGGFITGLVLVTLLRPANVQLFHPARTQPFRLAPRGRQRGPWG
ncbi:MAG TPA: rhomboid family intramembrane serine protease [Stellaceae bacterium]|nr:rhomboid family intramembrane serine protease [Stellaceae bacterium]